MTSEPDGAPLQLYDALRRATTSFSPLQPGVVRVYSCGPTVYSRAHLGNLRPYVFADTLRRALLWKGYDVRHIINITDVGHLLADADFGDDKVEVAAAREERTVWDLTAHYTALFKRDFSAVGCLTPERWTVATEFIPQMVEFAETLARNGHAYVLPTGLYFDTSTIEGYGAMASVSHDGLREGSRVEAVEGKHNPTDFALWRSFPPDAPDHAMEWDSPWGRGAPGWHLECSVMSIEALGPHFDIHTGGVDHREVHHPNEDAQSRAYLGDGEPWVGRWMHNEFLVLPKPPGADGDEKISKSKGHVVSLDTVTDLGVDPLAFRLFLLASHYRSQAKLTDDEIRSVGTRLTRLVETVGRRLPDHITADADRPLLDADAAFSSLSSNASAEHLRAMDAAISDDLGTPLVLATLDTALKDETLDDEALLVLVDAARSLLGLDLLHLAAGASASAGTAVGDDDRAAIENLIAQRDRARAAKDFATADALRDRLRDEHAVVLTDGPDGPTWTIAPS